MPREAYGPKVRVLTDPAELPALVEALRAAPSGFVIDTETTSEDPLRARLVGVGLSWGEAPVYLPIAHQAGPNLSRDAFEEALAPILADPRDFAAALPAGRALIGLDLGTRTIGVAVSDTMRRVASPLRTLPRTRFGADAASLLALAEERRIAGFVLGLPLNMDGSEGPRAQSVRSFARNLAGVASLPITFWDERLSTVAAERALLEADASRRRRAEVIDHVAAGYILQGFLDRLGHLEGR